VSEEVKIYDKLLHNSSLKEAVCAPGTLKMMAQFAPDYPPAKALQNQIAQLDQAIGREERRVGGSLRETYDASVARENALQRRVNDMKTDVLDLRRRSIQYNIYQRDADTNRQLYDALLQRYKEIGIAGGVGTNNISVVDSPEVPASPSSPKLAINLLIALISGLAIGVGAAWVMEQIDQGIADPDEIKSELHLPLLGTIPKILTGAPLSLLDDRKSMISEAYTSIQTNLSFSTDHGLPRSIAITSTRPAEGKSTSAFALALSMARLSRRVLLVDGDMRSPSVHHLLGIENRNGLSNFLAGDEDWQSLVRPSGHENLSIMTSGPLPPSAPDLLIGNRFEHLLAELLDQFDNIVIDSPPVMGLADAPLIGTKVEGMVYVVESHSTQKGMVLVALSRLRATKTALVGVILTKFDAKRAHYGYDYNYGYGYGYGEATEQRK
jgi:capsular exopolysaccharide synthesis family protein